MSKILRYGLVAVGAFAIIGAAVAVIRDQTAPVQARVTVIAPDVTSTTVVLGTTVEVAPPETAATVEAHQILVGSPAPTTTAPEVEVTPPATFPDGTLNPCLLRDGGRVVCDDWQNPVCDPASSTFTCPPVTGTADLGSEEETDHTHAEGTPPHDDDDAQAAAVDPGPAASGPGGTVVGDQIPQRLAMIFDAPLDTPAADLDFGLGHEAAPIHFHEPAATDLRLVSCDIGGTTGPAQLEASGFKPGYIDAEIAAGRCAVIGMVGADGSRP